MLRNWNRIGRNFYILVSQLHALLNKAEFSYFTEKHFSYLNRVAFASYSIPHCTCTLTNFSLTVGRAAISVIAFCHESSLVLLLLILYTGQCPTAAHYPHVVHESQSAWRFCVHLFYTCICIMSLYPGIT